MLTLHRSLTHTAALAVLLGTTALALPLYAADAAPTQASAPAKPAPKKVHAASSAEKMENHVEVRIKTLHDALKITAEQEADWTNVAQTMRDNEESFAKLIEARKANTETMTAVDDIKSYQDIAQAHADGLAKFVAAFEPFYNDLTDTQKKTADTFFSKAQRHDHSHTRAAKAAAPTPAAVPTK